MLTSLGVKNLDEFLAQPHPVQLFMAVCWHIGKYIHSHVLEDNNFVPSPVILVVIIVVLMLPLSCWQV